MGFSRMEKLIKLLMINGGLNGGVVFFGNFRAFFFGNFRALFSGTLGRFWQL